MDDYVLTVEIRDEPGHVLITVAGEVDIATVPQLQERLATPAASRAAAWGQPACGMRPAPGPAAVHLHRPGPPDPARPHYHAGMPQPGSGRGEIPVSGHREHAPREGSGLL
jgi:hypothetical protein